MLLLSHWLGGADCGFSVAMGSRRGGACAASGIFGVLGFFFGAIASPLVGLMGEMSMVPQIAVMFGSSTIGLLLFVCALYQKLPATAPVNI